MDKIKIAVKDQVNCIFPLLSQYFESIEISEQADIKIINSTHNIIITDGVRTTELNKPVAIRLLINSLENYIQKFTEQPIKIGPIDLYLNKRLCYFNNEEISLTQKETEILEYFIEHQGEVNKNSLLQDVFGYTQVTESHTVETHIYNLRNKFANKYEIISFKNPYYILNK